jgi:deoxyribodipyrimidine photo-lyase
MLHKQSHLPYTHLLPLYVFPAEQIEVSGFLFAGASSPYPEARSLIGGFWRCGPHRAKFIAESVWNFRESLQNVGTGLEIRVGMIGDVLQHILEAFKAGYGEVTGVWMTGEEGVEEKREERDVMMVCREQGVEFKVVQDEKFFVDELVENPLEARK